MPSQSKKIFFFMAGCSSLLLGLVGIFLPLLPTVPFILLSAFCFSKSSNKIHQWMLQHPYMGPLILSWRRDGIIPLKVKYWACTLIIISFSSTLILVKHHWLLRVTLITTAISLIIFICSRPHQVKS